MMAADPKACLGWTHSSIEHVPQRAFSEAALRFSTRAFPCWQAFARSQCPVWQIGMDARGRYIAVPQTCVQDSDRPLASSCLLPHKQRPIWGVGRSEECRWAENRWCCRKRGA